MVIQKVGRGCSILLRRGGERDRVVAFDRQEQGVAGVVGQGGSCPRYITSNSCSVDAAYSSLLALFVRRWRSPRPSIRSMSTKRMYVRLHCCY